VSFQDLESPLSFLESTQINFRSPQWLKEYEAWWQAEGQGISDAVDRAGTPWLRMFDLSGKRVDQILYSPEYWRMLKHGYRSGWLLGQSGNGIYLILEVLNASRVANSLGSVALAQRAMADALSFARNRMVFGKLLIEQPLMRRQFDERFRQLRAAARLAWKSLELLNEVWQQRPPYSDRYHLFRLVAHLSKYWSAELAVQTAKWSMEVHGGLGTLQEFRAERWLREAMILAIWEGPSHRQILDALEVMERKHAHKLLFQHLSGLAPTSDLETMQAQIERHLTRAKKWKQERKRWLRAWPYLLLMR